MVPHAPKSTPKPMLVAILFLILHIKSVLGQPRNITNAVPGITFTGQFVNWYPQYGFIFDWIRRENCEELYEVYRSGYQNLSNIQWFEGGDENNLLSQPVTQCLLNNTNDFVKSAMASAQVLLGLTPTMLAVLGASTEELNLVSVVARRPILATLLALGSPSVFVSRAFEYSDPVGMLQDRGGRRAAGRLHSRFGRWVLLTIQYICAIGAMANVGLLNWDIGSKTICSFWSNNPLAPAIWGVMVLPIHAVGGIIMRLRVRRDSDRRQYDGSHTSKQWFAALPSRIRDILHRTEGFPAISQSDIYITAFKERKWSIGLSWLLSVGIVCQVIFGTLVLSSLNFIGPRDALSVVGRYMVSVLVCRVICMHEISGLRERCDKMVLKYEKPQDRALYDPESAESTHITYPVGNEQLVVQYDKTRIRYSVVSSFLLLT